MQQFFRQAILRFVKCHNVVRLQPIPQVGHGRTVQAQVAAGPVFRHGEAALVLPDGSYACGIWPGCSFFAGRVRVNTRALRHIFPTKQHFRSPLYGSIVA